MSMFTGTIKSQLHKHQRGVAGTVWVFAGQRALVFGRDDGLAVLTREIEQERPPRRSAGSVGFTSSGQTDLDIDRVDQSASICRRTGPRSP